MASEEEKAEWARQSEAAKAIPARPKCAVCGGEIQPMEFRFKVWNIDHLGNTGERRYVHMYHARS